MIYWTLSNVLSVTLASLASVISVWGYGRSRKVAYLVMAAGSILGIVTTITLPVIQRARIRAWYTQHPISEEAQKAWREESIALAKKYSTPGNPPSNVSTYLPVGAVLGLVGLWLLVQGERPRKAEPNAGGNAAPPRASA